MGYVQIAKMGLENFSKYGKLIGTGKNNGIRVFEELSDGKRILRSVDKNGELVKVVTKQTVRDCESRIDALKHLDGYTRITQAKNYKTGDEMMHIRDNYGKYNRVVRSNKNSWESFSTINPHRTKSKEVVAYNDVDGEIHLSSYDLANQKGLKHILDNNGHYHNTLKSWQINDGKVGKYQLNEELSIPNLIKADKTMYEPGNTRCIRAQGDSNLAKQVMDYFDGLVAKLSGYKPKA